MKSNLLCWLLPFLAAALFPASAAADEFQTIDATMTDRAVVMDLPEGVRRVRLRLRQADQTWKLCTIAHLEGTERYLKLRLPDGVKGRDIEVAASFADPFPFRFYLGSSSFGTTVADGSTRAGPGTNPRSSASRGSRSSPQLLPADPTGPTPPSMELFLRKPPRAVSAGRPAR